MTHCGSCLCVKQNVVCGCTLRRNVWTCVNDSLWQLSLRQTECCRTDRVEPLHAAADPCPPTTDTYGRDQTYIEYNTICQPCK